VERPEDPGCERGPLAAQVKGGRSHSRDRQRADQGLQEKEGERIVAGRGVDGADEGRIEEAAIGGRRPRHREHPVLVDLEAPTGRDVAAEGVVGDLVFRQDSALGTAGQVPAQGLARLAAGSVVPQRQRPRRRVGESQDEKANEERGDSQPHEEAPGHREGASGQCSSGSPTLRPSRADS